MSEIAVRVRGLGKRFVIGVRQPATMLREALIEAAAAPLRLLSGHGRERSPEEFWALRGMSFDIRRGEVVGVIGRNGAGKSTLLKILSRITEPSEGVVEIHGRVGSLLEVGTGFHPELSGRENVYLNGAILGMRRGEIRARFDEIVEFAGVERFLDTPVKRYSSGMRVRLGFAVAAYLNPEILIVDEVLAVGDAEFQKKCLGKMGDVARSGRTVLFVSHNMPSVQALCGRGIFLQGGGVRCDTTAEEAVRQYLLATKAMAEKVALADRVDRVGSGEVRFVEAEAVGSRSGTAVVAMNEDLVVRLRYVARRAMQNCNLGLHVVSGQGQVVYRAITRDMVGALPALEGEGTVTCRLKGPRLLPGGYSVTAIASTNTGREPLDIVEDATKFEIQATDVYGTGKVPEMGLCYAECEWDVR